jgi:hypothetical protein
VPQERVPDPARPDALLGRGVLPHEREDGVGGRVQERRVDDALHTGGHGGVHRVEVLLEPVLRLGGRHEIERVRAGQGTPQAGRVAEAAGVDHDVGTRRPGGAGGVADHQAQRDVGPGEPVDHAAAERSRGTCDGDHARPASVVMSCGIMTPSNVVRHRLLPGGTPCASAS